MTDLSPRQQDTLSRGLAAFDAASRSRRSRRSMVRAGIAVACLGATVLAADRLLRSVPPRLPAYLEIISTDLQLVSELEMANACERIARTDGRLCVVECVPARQ